MSQHSEDDPPAGPRSKIPVVRGEWHGDVAGVACWIGLIAAGLSTWLFVWATSGLVIGDGLGAGAGVLADAQWVDGSYAQRATLLVVMFSLWVASLVLIAAAVLAVIETRAVLTKAPASAAAQFDLAGASVPDVIKAAGVLVDKLSTARGIVVLGVSGMVIAGLAMLTMMTSMSDGGGTVSDGAGQTATPTTEQSGQTVAPGDGADDGSQTRAPSELPGDGTAPGDGDPAPTG